MLQTTEMISTKMMWVVMMLDRTVILCENVAIISCILTVALIVVKMVNSANVDAILKPKLARMTTIVLCIIAPMAFMSMVGYAALPNTNQMAAIIVVPAIVNNPQVQRISSNSMNILEQRTLAWLDEITPEPSELVSNIVEEVLPPKTK